MGVRQFKPTSPGRRFMTISDFDEVTRDKPEKSLLAPVKRHGGRNNTGRITTRHQGGGHKRRYRIIDFKRRKDGVPATVAVDRVRPQPLGAHRAAALRGRPQGLHPGAGPAGRRVDRAVRRGRRHQGRQLPAAVGDPDRHDRARGRAAARPGRAHGALGRRERPAGRPRGGRARCCACPPASSAASPRPAARRSARSPTRRIRTNRAARPVARAGWASARRCAVRP